MTGLPETFVRAVQLAKALGATPLNQHTGCWEHQVDERWWIAINAHGEPMPCSHGELVPAFSMLVEWNDWPAGIIDPGGGVIAAGEAANEDTFIAAVLAATEAQRSTPPSESYARRAEATR